MAHFAQLDENNTVIQVIVAEEDFISKIPGRWIQTSYNTRNGEHILGGTPLRKNFAAINYTYDAAKDAFLPPKLFASWTLNEETWTWDPPVERPSDGKSYEWDEANQEWVAYRE